MIQPPTTDDLESLFVNNEALDRIAAYLHRFNPIRTMNMERQEIRHSAILAWLLDPSETHGLSDRFLKAFIAEAFRGQTMLGAPTALDVSQSDLRDAEVRREWQNIDILVLSARNGWAFVIENKFDAKQHEGQLTKYAERVTAIFDDSERPLVVRGIFLTLGGEEPEDKSYAPVTYEAIVSLLPRLMAAEGQVLGQEVTTFLSHYLEVIKDATGMNNELKEMAMLARNLYRKHRKALDFIIEHGKTTDFSLAVENLFGENLEYGSSARVNQTDYMYAWHNGEILHFVPSAWAATLGGDEFYWPGCENWMACYPVALWFRLDTAKDGQSGTLRLKAEVGPAEQDCRATLIDALQRIIQKEQLKDFSFRTDAAYEGRRFSRFLGRAGAQVHDISDAAQIADAMRKLLVRYESDFAKLTPAVAKIKKFGQPA